MEDHIMQAYIHYGADHFVPEWFTPIRNGKSLLPKPKHGTGLWASKADDKYGWYTWCRKNEYKVEELDVYFRFILPEAHILTVSDPEQLIKLPKIREWDYERAIDVVENDLISVDLMNGEYIPTWCYLDFEKLSEKYDAIELINSPAFYNILYSWDCDSILVLNPDRIKEIQ